MLSNNNQLISEYFSNILNGPFVDLPLQIPRERYEAAIDLIVSRWTSLSQRPISIYQIGQVSAPGFSDIDFIVVFPDNTRVDWAQYQPEVFPDWVQQLMTHPPYCCKESTWFDLPGWYPTFDMRHLWGDRLPKPDIPNEFASGCALGMLIDYFIVKVPRDVLWIAWEHPLRVIILANMLHSFKYIIRLSEKAGVTLPKGVKQIAPKVANLRASWFDWEDSKRLEMLTNLTGEVVSATGELIHNIDAQLTQMIGKSNSEKEASIVEHSNLFNFMSPWSFSESMRIAFDHYLYAGKITWINPASFRQILAIYADERSELHKYLETNGCRTKLQWDGGVWNTGLRYHARAIAAYGTSATRLGVPSQKYIALGYSPQPSYWKLLRRRGMQVLKGEVSVRRVIVRLGLFPLQPVLNRITSSRAAVLLGEPLFRLLGMRCKKRAINLRNVNRVLVVRLDEIGDVVMMTPFLRELRRNLPDAWITLVVKPAVHNLVELCPYVNEVLTYDRTASGRFAEQRRHGRALRLGWKHLWRRRFDLAILPRWGADYYHGSFLTYFSGAPRRVGYSANVSESKQRLNSGLDCLLSHKLEDSDPKHEIEHNLDVIRFLGGTVQEDQLELWLGEDDETFAEKVLNSKGVHPKDLLFAFGPGKRDLKRRWPLSRFVELGVWLKRKYQVYILIVGEETEESLVQELQQQLGDIVINMVGRTNLRQAVSLLKHCHLYIGNDYGPKHMALAVGVPVIEINAHPLSGSPSHQDSPQRFGPWGVPHLVLQPKKSLPPCSDGCDAKQPHCILNVSVAQVKEAVEKIMKQKDVRLPTGVPNK